MPSPSLSPYLVTRTIPRIVPVYICVRGVWRLNFWHRLCAGIWPEGSDGTDVNAVDVFLVASPSASPSAFPTGIVATADDFGTVKLFRYPCVGPQVLAQRHFLNNMGSGEDFFLGLLLVERCTTVVVGRRTVLRIRVTART